MKKPYKFTIVVFSLILGMFSCKPKTTMKNTSLDKALEQQVDSVLNLMNIEEKIGQMVQYSAGWDLTGPASTESAKDKVAKMKKGLIGSVLNVISVKEVREAQKLVMENSRLKIPMIFAYDVIHGLKTMFPIPLGESASWDLELIEQTAKITAKETMIDSSQLSARKSPTTGISLTSGTTAGEKNVAK